MVEECYSNEPEERVPKYNHICGSQIDDRNSILVIKEEFWEMLEIWSASLVIVEIKIHRLIKNYDQFTEQLVNKNLTMSLISMYIYI